MLRAKTDVLQDHAELVEFARVIRQEHVHTYLEIGSKFGGSLWHVACALDRPSRVVSIDLQGIVDLKQCIDRLTLLGHDARLLVGDSADPKVVDAARALGPYDLCFIDANHTEPYVRKDWANYGPMARIVAFHDIGYDLGDRPQKPWRIEVPKVWNEIKTGYRHQEIKMCSTKRDNGIGILWH